MSRVSPERIFKSHYPTATIERQGRGYGKAYYLVRMRPYEQMWSGCGDTKAQAWKDACERLGLTALKTDDVDPAGKEGS